MSIVNANQVSSEIGQLINGEVTYGIEDSAILQLIAKHDEKLQAIQYKSDLDLLKDPSSSEPSKTNAKQRLSGFLRRAAAKLGETGERIAVDVLSSYLEKLSKGGA
jgi:hypothetical protein